jgi:regulator of cell morphogenesis and NO signaling
MTTLDERTVGSIVAEDYRAAAIFTAHGIDLCCHGGRSFKEACAAKQVDPAVLEGEIRSVMATDRVVGDDPAQWTLTRLAEHIETVHHAYVGRRSPILKQYLEKLCAVHGDRHQELFDIAREFNACAGAMAVHMKKEELMLFPFIKRLEKAASEGAAPPSSRFGTLENPVAMMMEDHDAEGERFRRIAEWSGHYTLPADGCTTYDAALNYLREFEQDLHRHIHLENNLLFPRAIVLERSLR